jgi:hypothetical protein
MYVIEIDPIYLDESKNPRSKESRKKIAKVAAEEFIMKKFVPNEQKTKEIEEAVAKKDKDKDQE